MTHSRKPHWCVAELSHLDLKRHESTAFGSSQAAESEVTPVQQVINLMKDMMEKGKQEKHDESVQFAAYKEFCENTRVSKEKAIAAAEERIDELKATIEKLAAEAKVLGEEIAAHDEDISVWKGDVDAATKVRAMEKADYDAMHKDYSESVSALERAIEVLKKQDKKNRSGVALAAGRHEQVHSHSCRFKEGP